MKAAVIRKYGKPEVLSIADMPEPVPGPREVKIRVVATSVNPVDWKIRSGMLALISGWKFPRILGGDFSGEVLACGSAVTDLRPGDPVYGLSPAMGRAGAYAEILCCAAGQAAPKPATLNHHQSAAIPLAASTACQALYREGRMRPGMRVLVTGATGGVGHFAVQIAKAAGCHVTGVCHSRNAALARQFGCDEVLPYDKESFLDGRSRYDLIFDAAAKNRYFSSRSKLTAKGTYVTTMPMPGILLAHAFSFLPGKRGRFVGVVSNRADLEFLAGLADRGELKPYIEHEFPLEEIAAAHALSETEKVRGKIVVSITG